jgi:Tfp pilus assembly protein PilF
MIVAFVVIAGIVALFGMPYYRLLRTGMRLMKKQDFEAAIYCFKQACDAKPTRWMPRDHLARAYLGAGQIENALNSFEEALERDSTRLRSKLGLGVCLVKTRQHPRAIEVLNELIEENPNLRDAHLALAEAYTGLGREEEARAAFKRAAIPGGAKPSVLYSLAILCLGRGDRGQAKVYLEEILRQDPDHRDARLTLAAVYRDEGDPQSSLEVSQEAVKREPKSAEAHLALGISQAALGRWDEARSSLEECLDHDGRLAGAHYHMARIHARDGKTDDALASLKLAVNYGFPTKGMIDHEPMFDDLRHREEFGEIVR